MTENTIKVSKKSVIKGEDGYKTFSIRIREEVVTALDELAEKSNRSRNEIINIILEYGTTHMEITE